MIVIVKLKTTCSFIRGNRETIVIALFLPPFSFCTLVQ